jgi:hypothetical protein
MVRLFPEDALHTVAMTVRAMAFAALSIFGMAACTQVPVAPTATGPVAAAPRPTTAPIAAPVSTPAPVPIAGPTVTRPMTPAPKPARTPAPIPKASVVPAAAPVQGATPARAATAATPARPAAPALDLASLEQRLKDTKAIGIFTKLSLKNQVDDLLARFRDFYNKKGTTTLTDLRQKYDLLLLKVLSVLQDGDPALAAAISASRETLWRILADPQKFATL